MVSYWKSGIDEPTADLSTAVLRITPFDGTSEGSSASSANFTLDNVSPTTPTLSYTVNTTANSEVISGTTSANAYIFANGNLVAQADGAGAFSFTVNLKAGHNLYLIRAVDNKLNVSGYALAHIITPGPDSSGSQTVEESMAGEEEVVDELTPEELAELEDELIPEEATEEIPEEAEEIPVPTPGPSIPDAIKDIIKDKIQEQIKDKLKNNPQAGIQGVKQAISHFFSNGGSPAFEPAIKPKKPPKFTDKIFESKELGDAVANDVPKAIIEKYFESTKNFDANADSDGDQVTDEQELLYGANPFESDSDQDGLSDDEELLAGTELFNWDSDGDGLSDAVESPEEASTYNAPEVSQAEIASYASSRGIRPDETETLSIVDTDEDGLSDLQELEIDTDPLSADSDQDGYEDGEELINYGTDPHTVSVPEGVAISNADVDQLLEEGNQFFMGRAEPNSELEVYAVDSAGNSILIGSAVADAEGKFAVYTDPLEAGVYDLLVQQSNGENNVTDLSYPLTLVISGNDLLEEPALKRLGGKLLFSNTTIVAEWTDVLLGSETLNEGQSLLGSGLQLVVGQASEPGKTVVLKALRESGEESFLGQTMSDEKGKYTLFVELPSDEPFTVYAYTMEGERILDSSLPLLFNLQSEHKELAERLNQGSALVLDTPSPILDSVSVEADTAILTTWQSLVLSSTLVTDTAGQDFQAEVPEPLEPGRHAVTVYAVDRATGERSRPVQVEFDVVTAGVVAPALSEEEGRSPWIIFAVAGAALLGLMGFAAYRRTK